MNKYLKDELVTKLVFQADKYRQNPSSIAELKQTYNKLVMEYLEKAKK